MKKLSALILLIVFAIVSHSQDVSFHNSKDIIDIRNSYKQVLNTPGKHILTTLANGQRVIVDNSKTINNEVVFADSTGIPTPYNVAKTKIKIIAGEYGKMCLQCEEVMDKNGKPSEVCIQIDCANAKNGSSGENILVYEFHPKDAAVIDANKLSNGVHEFLSNDGFKVVMTIVNKKVLTTKLFGPSGKELKPVPSSQKGSSCQVCIPVSDPTSQRGSTIKCFDVKCPDLSAETLNKQVTAQ